MPSRVSFHEYSRINGETIYVQVIDAPEVVQLLPELPHLREFASSLYNGEYARFFQALGALFCVLPYN